MTEQVCDWCGGAYREVVAPSTDPYATKEIERVGLTARGAMKWRALVCRGCGQLRLFVMSGL